MYFRKNLSNQPSYSLFLLLFLVASSFLVIYAAVRIRDFRKFASNSTVKLNFSKDKITVDPGNPFTVGIFLDTVDRSVSAAELHLNYDPSRISFQAVTPGNFLPVKLKESELVNNDGKKTKILIVGAQPGYPAKGVGLLASFTFLSTSSDPSEINTFGSQVAAIGSATNVLEGIIAASINVKISPAITNTPTSRFIPTNSPPYIPQKTLMPINQQNCQIPPPCLFAPSPCKLPTPIQGWCSYPPDLLNYPPPNVLPSVSQATPMKNPLIDNCPCWDGIHNVCLPITDCQ